MILIHLIYYKVYLTAVKNSKLKLLYFGLLLIRVNSPLNTAGYQGLVQPEP